MAANHAELEPAPLPASKASSANCFTNCPTPPLRTYEMLCLHFQGWADLDELTVHLEKLRQGKKAK